MGKASLCTSEEGRDRQRDTQRVCMGMKLGLAKEGQWAPARTRTEGEGDGPRRWRAEPNGGHNVKMMQ